MCRGSSPARRYGRDRGWLVRGFSTRYSALRESADKLVPPETTAGCGSGSALKLAQNFPSRSPQDSLTTSEFIWLLLATASPAGLGLRHVSMSIVPVWYLRRGVSAWLSIFQ